MYANGGDATAQYSSQVNASVETGTRTVTTCILGNIATELGRPVEWDAAKQYFVNDAEAEKFYHRAYREGYSL